MKVYILTFGCKVNQYESEVILEKCEKSNFEKASSIADADIVIVNSCTVTGESDKKVRKAINKVKKENKDAIIILTGCLPQAFPENNFSDVDIVVGNNEKSEIVNKLKDYLINRKKALFVTSYDKNSKFDLDRVETFYDRTRAFVKIEDGCNRFCSYCIIPYARGRVRSKPIDALKKEIQSLADNGYKEIVLVGINLSSYGQDIGLNLCDAVEAVCNNSKIKRVRLGSLEPDYLDENIIKRLSMQKKLCDQFHVALQSGCDETLNRMNRHYKSSDYADIIITIRDYFKNAAITTDVMVGFPGETESEFLKSLNFVESMNFAKVHVFPYSIRPGTVASSFEGQVTKAEKANRVQKITNATKRTRDTFLKRQIGSVVEVLFEKEILSNVFEGYTKNYLPVKVNSTENLCTKIKLVKIIDVKDDYCIGTII